MGIVDDYNLIVSVSKGTDKYDHLLLEWRRAKNCHDKRKVVSKFKMIQRELKCQEEQ